MKRVIWIFAVLEGCALMPAHTNSPLESPEGIKLSLLGEDCEDRVGSSGDPVTRTLLVKVELRNPTSEPLTITPAGIVLSVEGESLAPVGSPDPIVLPATERRTLSLKFDHHARCSQDFALAFARALAVGDRPVEVAALHFTPY